MCCKMWTLIVSGAVLVPPGLSLGLTAPAGQRSSVPGSQARFWHGFVPMVPKFDVCWGAWLLLQHPQRGTGPAPGWDSPTQISQPADYLNFVTVIPYANMKEERWTLPGHNSSCPEIGGEKPIPLQRMCRVLGACKWGGMEAPRLAHPKFWRGRAQPVPP